MGANLINGKTMWAAGPFKSPSDFKNYRKKLDKIPLKEGYTGEPLKILTLKKKPKNEFLSWNSSSTLERLKLSVFFISYLHNTSINQYDDEETEETDKTDENEQEVNIIGLSILHSIPGFYFNNQNLNQNQNEGNENENNNDNDINNDNDNDNQILDLERDQLLNFI